MSTLEVRRHTMRVKPGQNLSQEGVTLARRLGEAIGPFARVVTSTVPRAYETAIAMGFAVDQQFEMLTSLPDDVGPWDVGFAAWGQRYQQQSSVTLHGRRLCDLALGMVRSLADNEAALVIAHGGIVELMAVACLPGADHAAWGPACDYCEGVRLSYHPERGFAACSVLRIDRHETEGAETP